MLAARFRNLQLGSLHQGYCRYLTSGSTDCWLEETKRLSNGYSRYKIVCQVPVNPTCQHEYGYIHLLAMGLIEIFCVPREAG